MRSPWRARSEESRGGFQLARGPGSTARNEEASLSPPCAPRIMKILLCLSTSLLLTVAALAQEALKLATFDVDATPPLGSYMAYNTVKRLDELTLRCRGIVLLGAGQPIV